MSVPLGEEPSRREGGPRPTEHQLRMAEVRSRATGESVPHVLSVFMGVGRYGGASVAAVPEEPLADAPPGPPSPEADAPERLATVIPLSRAARGKGASGLRTDGI